MRPTRFSPLGRFSLRLEIILNRPGHDLGETMSAAVTRLVVIKATGSIVLAVPAIAVFWWFALDFWVRPVLCKVAYQRCLLARLGGTALLVYAGI